jgi:hypothetical protein
MSFTRSTGPAGPTPGPPEPHERSVLKLGIAALLVFFVPVLAATVWAADRSPGQAAAGPAAGSSRPGSVGTPPPGAPGMPPPGGRPPGGMPPPGMPLVKPPIPTHAFDRSGSPQCSLVYDGTPVGTVIWTITTTVGGDLRTTAVSGDSVYRHDRTVSAGRHDFSAPAYMAQLDGLTAELTGDGGESYPCSVRPWRP